MLVDAGRAEIIGCAADSGRCAVDVLLMLLVSVLVLVCVLAEIRLHVYPIRIRVVAYVVAYLVVC